MQSTAKVNQTDPHDGPAIAPDVIPVTWADKVLADITRDARTIQPESRQQDRQPQPHAPTSAVAVPAPAVDTTFRAAAVGDIKPARAKPPRRKWVGQVIMIFLFALVSAFAAGIWKHYGGPARQMIAEWTPLISEWAPQFALASSPPTEATASTDQPAAPAEQTAAADQTAPPQDGATAAAAPAAAPPASAPPASAPVAPALASASPDSAELIQSMQRDLAAMGQQIEQLKVTIAELKANQQPATPVAARTPEARSSEIRPTEARPPAPAPRPRVTAVQPPPPQPPRPAPPLVRRPPPVQASAAPMQLASPPPPPAPPAQTTAEDGEPVVRPPMPLRWGNVNE
jgi:hypothetical protein